MKCLLMISMPLGQRLIAAFVPHFMPVPYGSRESSPLLHQGTQRTQLFVLRGPFTPRALTAPGLQPGGGTSTYSLLRGIPSQGVFLGKKKKAKQTKSALI